MLYVSTGNDLVLGPSQSLIVERTEDSGLPLEQAITRQRMRPGSGSLCLRVTTDGPTRVRHFKFQYNENDQT